MNSRRVTALLVVQLLAVAAVAADLSSDPAARKIFWILMKRASAHGHHERAAFLVRDGQALTFVLWQSCDEPDTAKTVGVPAGTVAIVHTHPDWLRMPSRIDAHTAAASHLPVYVITARGISRTTGRGGELLVDGEWSPWLGRPCRNAEALPSWAEDERSPAAGVGAGTFLRSPLTM